MLQIGLSKKHLNRLVKGQGFQLSHAQLHGSGPHQVEIEMPEHLHKRFAMAHSKGTGIRLGNGLGHKLLQVANRVKNNVVSVTGGRLIKGSQHAKKHMARIRGLRKIVGGSTYAHRLARRTRNTFQPVVDAVKSAVPVLQKVYNATKPILKPILKSVIPMATNAGLAYLGPEAMAASPAIQSGLNKVVDGMGVIKVRGRGFRRLTGNSTLRDGVPLARIRGGSFTAP